MKRMQIPLKIGFPLKIPRGPSYPSRSFAHLSSNRHVLPLSGSDAMAANLGLRVFQSHTETGLLPPQPTSASEIIQVAEEKFSLVDDTLSDPQTTFYDEGVYRNIQTSLNSILDLCAEFECRPDVTVDEVTSLRRAIRESSNSLVKQGTFGREVTTWPRGPGSSTAMQIVYEGLRNLPTYSTKAHYMDWFLRDASLCHAVRSRKNTLRNILTDELSHQSSKLNGNSIQVLDLANGPIQSLKEVFLSGKLDDATLQCIKYTGYDTDGVVQEANRVWIAEFGSPIDPNSFEFLEESALKGPFVKDQKYDVIYSIGFFDYLPDQKLVKLWLDSYEALNTGGSLVISLKDADRYPSQICHYFAEWDQFFQRNTEHFERLLNNSGMPWPETSIRDATGIILFYVVRKD